MTNRVPVGSVRPCEQIDSSYARDDALHANHIQALGTHDSYHQQAVETSHPSRAFSHLPLSEQLESGMRTLELDLHYRDGQGFAEQPPRQPVGLMPPDGLRA